MKATGVSGHFSAAHREPGKGWFHGHSWTVKAWFEFDGTDARLRQTQLRNVLRRFDHKELPPELAQGEMMAEAIGEELRGCIEVEVSREAEGLFARWTQNQPENPT